MPAQQQLPDLLAEARDRLRQLRLYARHDTPLGERVRSSLVQASALFRRLDFLINTETDRLYAPLREDRLHALERRTPAAGHESARELDDGTRLDRIDFSHLPQGKRNDLDDAAKFFGFSDTADTASDVRAAFDARQRKR